MKNIIETFRDELSRWMLPETHVGAGSFDEKRVALYAADWAVHEAVGPIAWDYGPIVELPRVTALATAAEALSLMGYRDVVDWSSGQDIAMRHIIEATWRALDTVTRPRLCMAHVADVARALESEELAERLLKGMVSL